MTTPSKVTTPKKGRLIYGVAYNYLKPNNNDSNKISFEHLDKDRNYYYDSALRIAKTDILDHGELAGLPLWCEHHGDIGNIIQAWTNEKDNNLYIIGEVTNEKMIPFIDDASFTGLSVGYVNHCEDGVVTGRKIKEISVVQEPFFKGCEIRVTATKNQNRINPIFKNITFKIMSHEAKKVLVVLLLLLLLLLLVHLGEKKNIFLEFFFSPCA